MRRRAVRIRRAALAGALALLAWGCGEEGGEVDAVGQRAAVAPATIETPAGGEAIDLRRYVAPGDFPLQFSTYLPSDFEAEFPLEGNDSAIAFTWERGEQPDSAFVRLFLLPPGQSEDAARELVRTVAERVKVPGDRAELDPVQRHDWAVVEYPIESRGIVGESVRGWVALARAGDHWYYVFAQAPSELWPRFEPRAELIMQGLRWGAPAG